MGGPGKGFKRGFNSVKCGLYQAPLSPTAFNAFARKGYVGVVLQSVADLGKMSSIRPCIKMNRDVIIHRGQPLGLFDNSGGIIVTQQDIGYF